MQAIGTTRQLQVEARDSANQVIPDPQVVFTSSDPSIITVDSDGLLRAVALGRAFVNVRIENQEHSVFMQVVTGYDVLTEIGTLGGDSSRAFAVNDQGYVAGDAQTASGEWHAFVYRGGEITDVGPSGVRSRAVAVNASGTVVGNAFPSGDTIHGVRPFEWKNGVITYLPLPDGSESGFVRDINDSGTAVGYSTTPCSVCAAGTVGSALRWDDGVLTDLGRLGGQQGYATAINSEGRIAGGVGPGGGGGWVEDGAVVTVLPTLVEAMSDAGHLISRAREHIHLWHDGEDHLVYVGHRVSFTIHGVDGAGQVIVQVANCGIECTRPEADIRLPDDRIFGLNDIIAPVTTWRLDAAMGISEDGLIAGYGRETPDGPVHGVVLKPRS
jgi:probable HAF family extracellular repeat protein